MKELTDRQKQVLTFIANYIKKQSYPPTIREIADHFEISVKGAHDHITALRKKGHLKQADKRPRTMGLTHLRPEDADLMEIPILGTVAAGVPILAEENFDGNILLHRSMLKKNKKYFALKVKGDSMSGAGILQGDTAIIEKMNTVRNGEIAVAVIDEAVTLKRFYKESSRIKLQAENPAYKPIYSQDVKILGRLFSIIRSY
ncbi:MAG: transcriptional repressor LexA [Treponema sp.]|nr:transcriptional repressor LexA [Treponema sp.]MCL2265637.1 transcriptional repressor LexA [Treponema sp.]MCL2265646.1 transcriptional repressor LexA [Treponema sp.]